MGFFRQEYRSGLPFPSPGDLPDPGIELVSPALADRFFNTAPPAKPCIAWLRCCGQAQSRGVENRQYKGYKKQGFLNTWHLSPYRDSHNLSFFSFSVLKIIYKFMLSPNSRSNGLTLPISFWQFGQVTSSHRCFSKQESEYIFLPSPPHSPAVTRLMSTEDPGKIWKEIKAKSPPCPPPWGSQCFPAQIVPLTRLALVIAGRFPLRQPQLLHESPLKFVQEREPEP